MEAKKIPPVISEAHAVGALRTILEQLVKKTPPIDSEHALRAMSLILGAALESAKLAERERVLGVLDLRRKESVEMIEEAWESAKLAERERVLGILRLRRKESVEAGNRQGETQLIDWVIDDVEEVVPTYKLDEDFDRQRPRSASWGGPKSRD